MNAYILPLNSIHSQDLGLVGGKALNLGEMSRSGFPVPGGFVVTTEAFKEFSAAHNLFLLIKKELEQTGKENLSSRTGEIRARLKESPIPGEIRTAIAGAVEKEGEEYFYAIRSSATAEDLSTASFAGQQDTYLHIRGKENIINAVRDCWASLYTERAVLYRRKNNIPEEEVQMAVVIQRMIPSEISGIMFTADPVSGNRSIISIDASYGLGEALVSGLVTPDIYKVNKKNNRIENIVVSSKLMEIAALPEGGTGTRETDPARREKQVLEPDQIKTLAALGKEIEKHYNAPQDIEWCYEKGRFTIVQSRGITSLYPLPSPVEKGEALHAYISLNHFQVMTDPISPLGLSVLRIVTAFDKTNQSDEDHHIFKAAGGRAYIDMSLVLQWKKVGKKLSRALEIADGLTSKSLLALIDREDFHARVYKDTANWRRFIGFMFPVLRRAFTNTVFRKPEKNLPLVKKHMDKRLREVRLVMESEKEGTEKLEEIEKLLVYTRDFKALMPALMPGMGGIIILEKMEQKWTGETRYTPLIIQGLEGNITTEMGLLIGDLADMIRESPVLRREFRNEDYASLFFRIDRLEGQEEFKSAFYSFMDIYDMRGSGEIDIARERWSENPEPLVNSLLSVVENAGKGENRKEFAALIKQADSAASALIDTIKQRKGVLKARIAARMIRVIRNHLPAREHPKYLIMKIFLMTKKAILREARKMKKQGRLKVEQDVFFLTFRELKAALAGEKDVLPLIEKRKADYARYSKMTPPRVITNEGEIIQGSYTRSDLPENALPGMPASAGVIEGPARVVLNPARESVKKGEILVAPFTDPGWTPLFLNASGLVMEVGGLLTHGTVVAREYGIPAVVGISDATKIIRTGDILRIDGHGGFVQILKKGE